MRAHRVYLKIEDTPGLSSRVYEWATTNNATKNIIIEEVSDVDNKDTYDTLQLRQAAFIDNIIQRSRNDGCHFLFHIDDDELIVVSKIHDCSVKSMIKNMNELWSAYHNI
ncbi:MAG: hypothetical protein EBV19_07105, partial [Flavobacteriia bacterium]|nr:hypothetical protein [Flavobacteriia bacterium]